MADLEIVDQVLEDRVEGLLGDLRSYTRQAFDAGEVERATRYHQADKGLAAALRALRDR